ncbi:hypothetical protein CRE_08154 [Caenorhabditis remanei]|uniref:Uncharacterized protein n=1 Tax=Caenorhabditis remanei TaxID=31234 RepID=E3M3Q9_CAERE|nr:hypothetical protein CRE_08154 [Caenorhabditis remanei]
MKKGKFLIVNEPTEETVDRELSVPTEKCDVFPALVYIPKFNKKMEKGLFCVLTILVQIIIFALMSYFFTLGYLAVIPIEVAFLALYAKEHVSVLRAQMFYLTLQMFFGAFVTFMAFLPAESGTRKDFEMVLPNLTTGTLALFGVFFGLFTVLRILLIASYHTHLFYSNLRDKFKDGKVILQPA